MTDLFAHISRLIPTLQGWADVPKAHTLASMVIALRPAVTIEIGVFGGRSFLPMALAHKFIGSGMCYGIDPWQRQESMLGQTGKDLEWWAACDHEAIFMGFMEQVRLLSVQNVTKICRMRSDDFTPIPKIDLLHTDGNHGPQAVKDVMRFCPHVRTGGICVMDDLGWSGGNVQLAAARLSVLGFTKLYDLGTGAAYQKISA